MAVLGRSNEKSHLHHPHFYALVPRYLCFNPFSSQTEESSWCAVGRGP